jgi:flagellar motor switch protein FliM
MRSPSPLEAQSASLVRPVEDAQGFPGLTPIGELLARGCQSLIAGFGIGNPIVSSQGATLKTFNDWRAGQHQPVGVCKYNIKPMSGMMMAALPTAFISQLVDGFYGGTGEAKAARAELSGAEARFLERLGAMLIETLTTAWAETTPLGPAFAGAETDLTRTGIARNKDMIAVQTLSIKGPPFGETYIECIYPVSVLRSIKALALSPATETAPLTDTAWRTRMKQAVLQVHFPIRTIFARTELPLNTLLALQTGDMIPICLPNFIPVTIGGRTFAEATVGESNGRASIRIETLEQGLLTHG